MPTEVAVIHLGGGEATKVGPRSWRKQILRWGAWHHPSAPGGVLRVTPQFAQRLVDNFRGRVWDHVPLGLRHDNAEEADAARGEVAALEIDTDGVYATVTMDDELDAKVAAGHIKGISAGIIPDYEDHEVGGRGKVGPVLSHAILTNQPYIKGLKEFVPVQLAEDSTAVLLSAYEEVAVPETLEQIIAKAKESKIDPKALAVGLGLDLAALEAEAARAKTLEAELAAARTAEPDPSKIEEVRVAAKAEGQNELVAALGEGLKGAGVITLAEGQKPDLATIVKAIAEGAAAGRAAQVNLAESRFEQTFTEALRKGKVVPAQKDALKDIWLNEAIKGDEVVTTLIESSPAKVDFSEHGTAGDLETNPVDDGIDPAAEVERLAKLWNTV